MRLLLLAALIVVSTASLAPLFKHDENIEGEYIVVMKHDGNLEDIKSDFENDNGMQIQREFRKVFKGFQAHISKLALRSVRLRSDVEYVEEDMVVKALTKAATWGLDRIDQRNLPLDDLANFPGDGKGTNAYIIDTGIFPSNSYFEARASVHFDAINPDGDGIDCNGHGTHCAGTVGSNPYGVARKAKLHGVRVLGCTGYGSNSAVIAGIEYVANNHEKPAIASLSIGSYRSSATDNAIKGLVNSGVPASVAAGNSNSNACNFSPAGAPEAITVGATQDDDNRAYFSNYGECVDIFAPGVDVKSTWIGSDTATNTKSGTSMACPHVTGAACILLGNNPNLTPEELKAQLLSSASDNKISDPGYGSPNKLLYIGTEQLKFKPKVPGKINKKFKIL